MSPVVWIFIQWAAILGPLWILAKWAKIYPTQRLVYAALVPGLLSLGLVVWAPWRWAVVSTDVLLVLAMIVDLLSLPRTRDLSVGRECGRIVSLGRPHQVLLQISNHSLRQILLQIRDGAPEELHAEPEEFSLLLEKRSRATLRYVLRPSRRGAFILTAVHLRVASRLRFWWRMLDYPAATSLRVYPNLQQLSQYAVMARMNRLSLLGVRRTRRIGQDQDFERLRDFTIDDNYKHIDWRTTARRQKLTVKDFQATQSQRVIFLIDCGRMMVNEAADLSLLDHSLNAMLMLSYVALRQNDAVGLLCFSDEIHGFVPPQSGMAQMNRLLHSCYDRFPRLVESRYDLAFRYLATHCRKRSLVVLITHVIDAVNAGQIDQYLSNLVGRHLPLGVLLRDRQLFAAADVDQPQNNAFWRAAAAADILLWRRQVLADLQAKGVLAMDVFPEDLTAPLINRYLQIKARHLL